jgi:hypothetical protein
MGRDSTSARARVAGKRKDIRGGQGKSSAEYISLQQKKLVVGLMGDARGQGARGFSKGRGK